MPAPGFFFLLGRRSPRGVGGSGAGPPWGWVSAQSENFWDLPHPSQGGWSHGAGAILGGFACTSIQRLITWHFPTKPNIIPNAFALATCNNIQKLLLFLKRYHLSQGDAFKPIQPHNNNSFYLFLTNLQPEFGRTEMRYLEFGGKWEGGEGGAARNRRLSPLTPPPPHRAC